MRSSTPTAAAAMRADEGDVAERVAGEHLRRAATTNQPTSPQASATKVPASQALRTNSWANISAGAGGGRGSVSGATHDVEDEADRGDVEADRIDA